ncbi:DUF4258 domain-containing protein [Candidatus Micrarchaeota archaeon]|nr:DUF4258 domain-containing protein [Candidatus Micrarchaeota archaeon]MBU2476920.1 DUF4258 domain-containing protein [Candidatus Micrarchaeota archaeon]
MESPKRCSFRPSRHAKDKMIETGIPKIEILEGIIKGAKKIFKDKIVTTFRGFDVVYKQLPCNYFVITVYWKNR